MAPRPCSRSARCGSLPAASGAWEQTNQHTDNKCDQQRHRHHAPVWRDVCHPWQVCWRKHPSASGCLRGRRRAEGAPTSVRSRLSTIDCRSMRARPAPSATRVAYSVRRSSFDSIRFATLTVAMSSTRPTPRTAAATPDNQPYRLLGRGGDDHTPPPVAGRIFRFELASNRREIGTHLVDRRASRRRPIAPRNRTPRRTSPVGATVRCSAQSARRRAGASIRPGAYLASVARELKRNIRPATRGGVLQ